MSLLQNVITKQIIHTGRSLSDRYFPSTEGHWRHRGSSVCYTEHVNTGLQQQLWIKKLAAGFIILFNSIISGNRAELH